MTTRELTAQLGDQLTRLVRDEIALARAELFAAARQAALSGGMLTAAMVAGLTCWLAMVTAAIAGIAAGLPIWASALIVGGVSGVSAGLLALLGVRRLRRGNPPLQLTVGSIREELTDLATRARTRQ
jgi:hypothetical protein